MTNDDLDRALAAAAANVGPSALDTLAREVRRLQGEAEATRDDHWARIGQYERRAEAAEAERDALREQVAEVQSLVEMVKAQTDELDRRKGLITQVQHWQDHTTERALNAEAERDALREQLTERDAIITQLRDAPVEKDGPFTPVKDREEAAFRAGYTDGAMQIIRTVDEALAVWQARQKGTPT